ncbi:hypothetical protein RB195_019527 [Necator americanus]|uniref:DM domain-containing protein n=1 Tax=Necator americanus TaxID=51031 RepID=A0ABR1CI64_NECAM
MTELNGGWRRMDQSKLLSFISINFATCGGAFSVPLNTYSRTMRQTQQQHNIIFLESGQGVGTYFMGKQKFSESQVGWNLILWGSSDNPRRTLRVDQRDHSDPVFRQFDKCSVEGKTEIDVVALSPAPSQNSYSSSQNEKKYFCQRCLNHDLQFPRKGHKPVCKYANCTCSDCIMVEQRRQLNNMLSKSKLAESPRETVNGRRVRDPQCARCRQHGFRVPLRGHKRVLCQFSTCKCEMCELVEDRRSLMAKQIKLRRDQQRQRNSIDGRHSSDSTGDHELTATAKVVSVPRNRRKRTEFDFKV